MKERMYEIVQNVMDDVIRNRRYFRENPEPSREEFNTQAYIQKELTALGIESRPSFNTGLIADIKGNRPGKTVAIRADMDALRLADESGLPFASTREGVCHGCGHDAHMAVLLGVARVFAKLQGDFPGMIRLLFQPSEEMDDGGAKHMIAEGCLDGVDFVIGSHIWQPIPSGTVGIVGGPIMASVSSFEILVQGHGGHGSMPHDAISPISIAADIVHGINEIVSNSVPSLDRASLSIGMLNSGTAFNVIPDKATLRGSIRTFSLDTLAIIEKRIRAIAEGAFVKYGASGEVKMHHIYPPTINDPSIASVVEEAAGEVLGRENVLTDKNIPTMASEDFSYFLQERPGAYYFLGTGNEVCQYPHHHPKFQIDEAALPKGIVTMAYTAFKLLNH